MGENLAPVADSIAELRKRPYLHDGAYSLSALLEILKLQASPDSFSIIRSLEESGYLTRIYRVESPTVGGLADYSSITKLPDEIEDFRTGRRLKVTDQNVKVLYIVKIN